jgi:hypothetical protein
MNQARHRKEGFDQLFADLTSSGRQARELGAQLETVIADRNANIHRASAEGISARAIAQTTRLSHARVQQIVQARDDQAMRDLEPQPALRQRRQDRERSRLLLARLAHADA